MKGLADNPSRGLGDQGPSPHPCRRAKGAGCCRVIDDLSLVFVSQQIGRFALQLLCGSTKALPDAHLAGVLEMQMSDPLQGSAN